MAGEVKIPIGLSTETALKDAQNLGKEIKSVLSNINMDRVNSKTLSFVKNLTSAYNRMEKLQQETEKLANTKLPTAEYVEVTKQLEKAIKTIERLENRQVEIQDVKKSLELRKQALLKGIKEQQALIEELDTKAGHGKGANLLSDKEIDALSYKIQLAKEHAAELNLEYEKVTRAIATTESRQEKLNAQIENARRMERDAAIERQTLEEENNAYIQGRDTQAYKEKIKALNVQNQAVNILLTRYAELNQISDTNVQHSNRETEATQRQAEATKELAKELQNVNRAKAVAEEHGLSTSGRVRRGPSLSKPGPVRGPKLSDVVFLKHGEAIPKVQDLSQAEDEASKSADRLNESTKRTTTSMRSFGGVVGEVGRNVLRTMRNALSRLVGLYRQLARHLHSSHKSHTGLMGNMKHSLSMILRYTIGIRSLFMLIRRLRSMVKEAFKVMAQEIPEVNEAISMLGTSFKQLKASFGTMLQPLLQSLAPILNSLIQKIVSLMNNVARFFATLTGQNYIYEATVANYDYAKSAEEAEKANEGALASFDKLNVVARDNSKNTMALTKDTVTYKKVEINPEDSWWTRLAKKIAEGWKNADLSEATNDIAKKIAGLLDSIKWEDIRAKSTKFSHTLATGINGLTLPDEKTGKSALAVSIGKTLAEALQTAIDTFDEFITTIKWNNLGKFIAVAIEELKKKLRDNDSWRKAGEAFGHLFQGLVQLSLELLVKDNVFEGLGADLSNFVKSVIEEGMKINPETNNTFIKDFGIALSTGLVNLLKEIEAFLDGSSDELAKAVNELFQGIDLFEIAKHLAIVFIKGLKTGLKLLVSAGLGALGLNVDPATAEFLAEALGIGILGTKIAKLIKNITGSGGLLNAFSRKDDALQRQGRKLGFETVAVGALGTALGWLGGEALANSGLIEGMTTKLQLNQNVQEALTGAVETSAASFSLLADAGKEATKTLEEDTKKSITIVAELLGNFIPKLNEVDTTAYDNLVSTTQAYIDRIKSMWDNAQFTANQPTYRQPSTTPSTEPQTSPYGHTPTSQEQTRINQEGLAKADKNYGHTPTSSEQAKINQDGLANAEKSLILKNAEALEKLLLSISDAETRALAAKYFSDYAAGQGYTELTDIFTNQQIFDTALKRANPDNWITVGASSIAGVSKADRIKEALKFSFGLGSVPSEVTTVLSNLLKWLPMAGSVASGFPIPFLAQGAVIPPNKPFLGILGDQRSGTNVETPLSTIEQAVANVLSRMQIKNVFDVQGDPYRLFKVVQKQATIEYNQSGATKGFT